METPKINVFQICWVGDDFHELVFGERLDIGGEPIEGLWGTVFGKRKTSDLLELQRQLQEADARSDTIVLDNLLTQQEGANFYSGAKIKLGTFSVREFLQVLTRHLEIFRAGNAHQYERSDFFDAC